MNAFFGIVFGKFRIIFYTFVVCNIPQMIQKYFFILFFTVFLSTGIAFAQEPKIVSSTAVVDLNFYPNPVVNGKIYITSKNAAAKEVSIYDVLGKRVLQTMLNINNKEVNVGSLSAGVYIIKIKEGEATSTRKLIVK
jgi:hypothetical protein